MQVEARPDSQRKQSIRITRIVSTRNETVKALPNGQVSLINKGEKHLAIASWTSQKGCARGGEASRKNRAAALHLTSTSSSASRLGPSIITARASPSL